MKDIPDAVRKEFPDLTIKDYTITGVVGEGGQGVVLALEKDGTLYTGKVVHRNWSLVEHIPALHGLQRSVDISQKLDHPSIQKIEEVIDEPRKNRFVIVKPYAKGQSLREMIDAQRAIPPERLVDILDKSLCALHYLHESKQHPQLPEAIFHRDIKPDHIIVADDGSVTLIDLDTAKPSSGRTTAYTAAGTKTYAAPEALLGTNDARSDLYSLGFVAVEALLGKVPQDLSDSRLPWREPYTLPDHVPEKLRAVVNKMVVADPDRRWQSAADVRKALGVCLEQKVENPSVEEALVFPKGGELLEEGKTHSLHQFLVKYGNPSVTKIFLGATGFAIGRAISSLWERESHPSLLQYIFGTSLVSILGITTFVIGNYGGDVTDMKEFWHDTTAHGRVYATKREERKKILGSLATWRVLSRAGTLGIYGSEFYDAFQKASEGRYLEAGVETLLAGVGAVASTAVIEWVGNRKERKKLKALEEEIAEIATRKKGVALEQTPKGLEEEPYTLLGDLLLHLATRLEKRKVQTVDGLASLQPSFVERWRRKFAGWESATDPGYEKIAGIALGDAHPNAFIETVRIAAHSPDSETRVLAEELLELYRRDGDFSQSFPKRLGLTRVPGYSQLDRSQKRIHSLEALCERGTVETWAVKITDLYAIARCDPSPEVKVLAEEMAQCYERDRDFTQTKPFLRRVINDYAITLFSMPLTRTDEHMHVVMRDRYKRYIVDRDLAPEETFADYRADVGEHGRARHAFLQQFPETPAYIAYTTQRERGRKDTERLLANSIRKCNEYQGVFGGDDEIEDFACGVRFSNVKKKSKEIE